MSDEDLKGNPKCNICYGSGIMPYYHWVEPCMVCCPLTDKQKHESNVILACTVIISMLALIAIKWLI